MELITRFTPFRMKLSNREPVQLLVEVVNNDSADKMLTLSILLSKTLSFDKGGYKVDAGERIEKLSPGESKRFYYELFPKPGIREGEIPVKVKLTEHYNSFDYVQNEIVKSTSLKVEE